MFGFYNYRNGDDERVHEIARDCALWRKLKGDEGVLQGKCGREKELEGQRERRREKFD